MWGVVRGGGFFGIAAAEGHGEDAGDGEFLGEEEVFEDALHPGAGGAEGFDAADGALFGAADAVA